MTVLAIRPEHNALGRSDVTGAFEPEGDNWVEMHGGKVATVDCRLRVSKYKRRHQVYDILERNAGLNFDAVGFICHGGKTWLQPGFRWNHQTGLDALANGIAMASRADIRVVLYACNCATTDYENFASRLRDSLVRRRTASVQVDAHHGRGHCTERPYVRRYTGPEYSGGQWIIMPKTLAWYKWVERLKGDLRLKFPFMTIPEIHEAIA